MKRFWYLFLFVGILGLCLVSCDKDDPANDDDDNTLGSVIRYEASVSDPTNYKIRVMYSEGDAIKQEENIKEVIVESPWTYELKDLKKGAVLYVSTFAVPRNDLVTPETKVTSKIFIDEKLKKESSGEFSAIVHHILGMP